LFFTICVRGNFKEVLRWEVWAELISIFIDPDSLDEEEVEVMPHAVLRPRD